jgi:site-specific DNA-methyltransferase (adenine-specific)
MKPYFQDENTTIYHADCREILSEMPKVDLVLTDPPYGIGYDPQKRKHWQVQLRATPLHDPYTWDDAPFNPDHLLLLCRPSIIWGANNFASCLPDQGGWLCWDKATRNGVNIRQAEFELAWTNCIQRGQMFRHLWIGGYRDTESGLSNYHPTQKPLALMRWCLSLVKDVNTVIDPYMGSGTTLRAAKDMNITSIGIEIDERYCEIAAKRMAQQVLAMV